MVGEQGYLCHIMTVTNALRVSESVAWAELAHFADVWLESPPPPNTVGPPKAHLWQSTSHITQQLS